MEELIARFPRQLEEALEIGRASELTPKDREIRNVVISGLGGSGIGGNFSSEFCADQLRVPVTVNKGYFIPNFVNEHTLFIVSSYSGNTEETLNALKQAQASGCEIACITSGGKLLETAKSEGYNHILIPGGMPPRTCMGYSLVQQLFLMNHYGLINNSFEAELEASIRLMNDQQADIRRAAAELASDLHGKLPILYAEDRWEAVLLRWRQQINENAKMLCWHHMVPEMNHNELVGWRIPDDRLAVIYLRSGDDFERNVQRMELNQEIIGKYTPNIIELEAKGEGRIQQNFYLVHLGDWVSYYLSVERQVDPVEVGVIDFLKGELAKTEW